MKHILMAFIAVILISSCNENRIYNEHFDPSGNLEWNRSEIIKHDIEIIDISIKYNLFLTLRFAVGYSFPVCDIIIIETSPSGKVNEYTYRFLTRDEYGYIGDIAGDIIDHEDLWQENIEFEEAGIYQYELSHDMTDDKIHMVMEVGMMVDKVVSKESSQ